VPDRCLKRRKIPEIPYGWRETIFKRARQGKLRLRNVATVTLSPTTQGTTVTWAMDGPSPLIAKIMSLFFDADTMIGGDFAQGLVNLKAIAEI
jgi:hypothetical protein